MASLPPVPAAYVPDAHGVQLRCDASLYCPLGHTEHDADPLETAMYPGLHSAQSVADVSPPAALYLPAAQSMHADAPTESLYVATAHIPQIPVPAENCPRGQGPQLVAPAAEASPAGHA